MAAKEKVSFPRTEKGHSSNVFSFRRIVYPWSSPIPVVLVEGDSYEMGRQFGAATAAIIKRDLAFNLPTLERGLAHSKTKKKDYLVGVESAITKHTDSGYLDEISGMAEAAGVAYDSLLLVNCNVDLLSLDAPSSRIEMARPYSRPRMRTTASFRLILDWSIVFPIFGK